MPLHDRSKPKKTNVDPESYRTKDMLTHILNNVEVSDKVLKEMMANFSSLNEIITSHSISIKQLETQMGKISNHLNQRKKGGLLSDTVTNPKDDNAQ